jgi:hypothetical protein
MYPVVISDYHVVISDYIMLRASVVSEILSIPISFMARITLLHKHVVKREDCLRVGDVWSGIQYGTLCKIALLFY